MIPAMCLIVFALNPDAHYRFVLVANRDEFHQRPTSAMHWWSEQGPLAGRDEKSGGTWLGIMPDGRVSAVTNYRAPQLPAAPRSRGQLPLELLSAESMPGAATQIHETQKHYGAFNLIGYDGEAAHCISSEATEGFVTLRDGIHGISNHLLDTPWPKLQLGRHWLDEILDGTITPPADLHDELIRRFGDTAPAPDPELPDTGVGLELERALSPVFIHGSHYGTRATTVVSITHDGAAEVTEKTYGPNGAEGGLRHFRFDTLSAQS
jgi:uncharacterized protein with NRDE domain